MAEQKPAVFARIDRATKQAMEATAARLGLSAANYLSNIIMRAVVEDASKVMLANKEHDAQIARLSAGNLIRVSGGVGYEATTARIGPPGQPSKPVMSRSRETRLGQASRPRFVS